MKCYPVKYYIGIIIIYNIGIIISNKPLGGGGGGGGGGNSNLL